MVEVRPFRALRPPAPLAGAVAALPYDVMDTAEAMAMAAGNPDSFLHISRPEIDLPAGTDPHDDIVYARGRQALDDFRARGTLVVDHTATYSVYRQRMGTHVQTGIALVASVTDYDDGTIRTHEHTRPDKELDRFRHIDALDAQDEPVFLLAPRDDALDALVDRTTMTDPVADVTTDDAITHTVWAVTQPADIESITEAFARMPRMYVADGHHRSAAASRIAAARRGDRAGGSAWFLVVALPVDEALVLPYHRVVQVDPDRIPAALAAIEKSFRLVAEDAPVAPDRPTTFGICAAGQWYRAHPLEPAPTDPVAGLDVAVLQDRVLASVFGIADPRTDDRLSFVGGIRGLGELELRARDSGIAFSLAATPIADLIAVADTGAVMPPKSTWFEPKLRSGLFAHQLSPDSDA